MQRTLSPVCHGITTLDGAAIQATCRAIYGHPLILDFYLLWFTIGTLFTTWRDYNGKSSHASGAGF